MAIQKFRSIEAMSAAPMPDRAFSLEKRIQAVLALSAALVPPWTRPKGVFRFRSIEEMQAQRDAWEKERARAARQRVIR